LTIRDLEDIVTDDENNKYSFVGIIAEIGKLDFVKKGVGTIPIREIFLKD
jgi:hypothetical protein